MIRQVWTFDYVVFLGCFFGCGATMLLRRLRFSVLDGRLLLDLST